MRIRTFWSASAQGEHRQEGASHTSLIIPNALITEARREGPPATENHAEENRILLLRSPAVPRGGAVDAAACRRAGAPRQPVFCAVKRAASTLITCSTPRNAVMIFSKWVDRDRVGLPKRGQKIKGKISSTPRYQFRVGTVGRANEYNSGREVLQRERSELRAAGLGSVNPTLGTLFFSNYKIRLRAVRI